MAAHSTTDAATPGSSKAVELGCRCSRVDNGYGLGIFGGGVKKNGQPMFWINQNCPLHGDAAPDAAKE